MGPLFLQVSQRPSGVFDGQSIAHARKEQHHTQQFEQVFYIVKKPYDFNPPINSKVIQPNDLHVVNTL